MKACYTFLPATMLLFCISCNPDPEKVISKNRELLTRTFEQLRKAGDLVREGTLPEKRMEKLPDGIRIVNSYYTSADYKGHNAVLLTADFCRDFISINDKPLPIGWDRPVANLADAFIRKNLAYYRGTYGGIVDDMKAFRKIEYAAICRPGKIVLPSFNAADQSFTRGEFSGVVYLLRLSDLHYFGSAQVNAASSANVSIPGQTGTYRFEERKYAYNIYSRRYEWQSQYKSGTYDRGSLEKRGTEAIMTDFRIQVDQAIERAVPLSSWNPFIEK